ncbi:MAG: PadR family transcriptional regulator [Clostridiaceae bacterium]|jgi:DNA-binding PadR family transcriptional regulator|nr:PadR family transcriptional regulator [Clostridiaceae bacterium]
MNAPDILRGHTDTIILNILKCGDSYGYEIAKTIYDVSGGVFDITEATVYVAFRRLEQAGFIEAYWGDNTGGARRRYYKITESGTEKYVRLAAEWQNASGLLNKLIGGNL